MPGFSCDPETMAANVSSVWSFARNATCSGKGLSGAGRHVVAKALHGRADRRCGPCASTGGDNGEPWRGRHDAAPRQTQRAMLRNRGLLYVFHTASPMPEHFAQWQRATVPIARVQKHGATRTLRLTHISALFHAFALYKHGKSHLPNGEWDRPLPPALVVRANAARSLRPFRCARSCITEGQTTRQVVRVIKKLGGSECGRGRKVTPALRALAAIGAALSLGVCGTAGGRGYQI